jgi:hypothetical protein
MIQLFSVLLIVLSIVCAYKENYKGGWLFISAAWLASIVAEKMEAQ